MKLNRKTFSNFTNAQIQSGILEFDMGKGFKPFALKQIWDATLGTKLGDKNSTALGMKASFDKSTGILSVDFIGSETTTAGNDIVVLWGSSGGDATPEDQKLADFANEMTNVAKANLEASKAGKDGVTFIGFNAGDYSLTYKGPYWGIVSLADDTRFNIATRISSDANQDIPDTWTMVKGQTLFTEVYNLKIDAGALMAYYNTKQANGKAIGSLRSL